MDRIPSGIRRYFVERIFGAAEGAAPPRNFAALPGAATVRRRIEGCPVPGQNIVTIELLLEQGLVADIRVRCERCDPFMFVAADLTAEWARGKAAEHVARTPPDVIVSEMSALLGFFCGKPRAFMERCERMTNGLLLALAEGPDLVSHSQPDGNQLQIETS